MRGSARHGPRAPRPPGGQRKAEATALGARGLQIASHVSDQAAAQIVPQGGGAGALGLAVGLHRNHDVHRQPGAAVEAAGLALFWCLPDLEHMLAPLQHGGKGLALQGAQAHRRYTERRHDHRPGAMDRTQSMEKKRIPQER